MRHLVSLCGYANLLIRKQGHFRTILINLLSLVVVLVRRSDPGSSKSKDLAWSYPGASPTGERVTGEESALQLLKE